MKFAVGDRVQIVDKTSQHNKVGTVVRVGIGKIIIVELEEGQSWPVFENEIQKVPEKIEAS